MASENTRGDALREFLTGAASDGAAQDDPALSLGGFRSSARAASLGMTLSSAIKTVVPLFVSGGNGEGTGVITATADTLSWTAPGSSAGTPVTFTGAQTKVLEHPTDAGKFVLASGTQPFTPGRMQMALKSVVHGLFGMGKAPSADLTSGAAYYRASIIKNGSAGTVTSFKRWLKTLGTARTTDSAQLGASGPGTITTTGSFADWPASGWCRVRQSGGTLREVVYYGARTATSLDVIARGVFGTTPAAGANTDVVDAIPGVVCGLDPAGVVTGAAIQTVADENTAPIGVTWNLGITEAGAATVASILAGKQFGVWLWRDIPAGASASPLVQAAFNDKWTV